MVHKTDHGLYQSSIVSRIPGVIHGFTSKANGSMLVPENQNKLFTSLGISPDVVVSADQVHGSDIYTVKQKDLGKRIEGYDGLLYKRSVEDVGQPLLTVHVGDCVPLLFIDQSAGIIGALHAGWKGTRDHIAKHMIQAFIRNGSEPSNILVVIGSYIHACCYSVTEERAMVFEREFPGGRGIVNRSGVSWFIDLGNANITDMKSQGVPEKNIEHNRQLCTLDNPLEFYSYRRKTEEFGEMLGFIGFTK